MKWTKKLPDKVGHWWCRDKFYRSDGGWDVFVANVYEIKDGARHFRLTGKASGMAVVERDDVEFSDAPIPEPEEIDD